MTAQRRVVLTIAVTAMLVVSACTSSSGKGTQTSVAATSSPAPTTSPAATSSAPATAASSSPTTSASPTTAHVVDVGPSGGPVPAKFTPMSTTFVSAATGWVLGTAPCSHKPCTSVLRTRDGGRTWRGIPAPLAPLGRPDTDAGGNGTEVSVLRFADQSDGWAAVGALYSTHNGGATWTRQHIGPAGAAVASIETGGGQVYALVDKCPVHSCSARYEVFTSAIGADHWSAVEPKIAGDTGGENLLVVHGADWFLSTSTGIYHGHGTGAAIRLPNPCPADPEGREPAAVAVADSTHLDALCQSEGATATARYQLYGTTDGGHHWTKAGGSHLLDSGFYGLADNSRGVLLLALASGTSVVARTTNDGSSFANSSIPGVSDGGIEWADLGFTTATQAVVILTNTSMFLSHDSGASFSKVRF